MVESTCCGDLVELRERQDLGEMDLGEIDPGRAAGSEGGPGTAFLEPVQQLGAFFHDHHIGGEVGVQHDIDANLLAGS